ncbi:Lin0368 family putative glycerol transporter subunit [Parabacteroides sp.]
MSEWLLTYNELFGMYNAGIITSIFGAFAVTFTVILCWSKLVKDFGPIGGFMAAALIIGTFWLVNHKLPGFGFSTGLATDANGLPMQFSLIHQGARGSAPWVDMGWAIAMGFVVCDTLCAPKGSRLGLLKEAFPRWVVIIIGGIVGGILVGLTGYTNAAL